MYVLKINESRLSDTRCMMQDVVSPHCGDKRMAPRCTKRSLPNYFDMTSYRWNVRQSTVTWHWWMNGKNKMTSCTKCAWYKVLYQHTMYVISLSNISIKANNKGWIKMCTILSGRLHFVHDFTLFFPFFHQC